jgi:hypothetical protein
MRAKSKIEKDKIRSTLRRQIFIEKKKQSSILRTRQQIKEISNKLIERK